MTPPRLRCLFPWSIKNGRCITATASRLATVCPTVTYESARRSRRAQPALRFRRSSNLILCRSASRPYCHEQLPLALVAKTSQSPPFRIRFNNGRMCICGLPAFNLRLQTRIRTSAPSKTDCALRSLATEISDITVDCAF